MSSLSQSCMNPQEPFLFYCFPLSSFLPFVYYSHFVAASNREARLRAATSGRRHSNAAHVTADAFSPLRGQVFVGFEFPGFCSCLYFFSSLRVCVREQSVRSETSEKKMTLRCYWLDRKRKKEKKKIKKVRSDVRRGEGKDYFSPAERGLQLGLDQCHRKRRFAFASSRPANGG